LDVHRILVTKLGIFVKAAAYF